MVAAVILLLVFGASERTTRPVPANDVHRSASSRAACMGCHGVDGVRPQPEGHTKADQCFQCHAQPEGWIGAGK
jgi:cytochrome c553